MNSNTEPTAEEMRLFCSLFSDEEWKELTNNKFFLKFYDKCLDTTAKIARRLLDGYTVNHINDIDEVY